MTRLISRVVLAVAMVCLTSVASMAQTTATSTETKNFEIVAVDGNLLVVRMPEGTREINVPPDFRFTVNGQQLAVGQLKAGMKGTATITTKTTYTPVTVTEVKNGTVMQSTGTSIIVRTDEGIKMFSQQELDKRGVRLMRDGKPAQLSQFRQGDQLSATIITSMPPRVMTEKEVQATTSTAAAAAKAPSGAASKSMSASGSGSSSAAPQAQSGTATTLPKTATSWPLFALISVLSLALGLALTIARRRSYGEGH
jgi:hypothetical protein